MTEQVIAFFVGLLCVVLGISNMRGNIASLHRYHRHRVSEEDRIPFGRTVGLGTILCGGAIMIYAGLSFFGGVAETVGQILLAVGLIAGIGISFYGMIKYNKGIF